MSLSTWLSRILQRDVLEHKRKHPNQKIILVMWETSLGARYTANPQNHRGYDAVFTYVDRLVDGKRYFFFPPRAFYRHRIRTGFLFRAKTRGLPGRDEQDVPLSKRTVRDAERLEILTSGLDRLRILPR